MPEPTSASRDDDASKRWLLPRLTLTYVAFVPLAAISGVTLTARGVEGSLGWMRDS